MVVLYFYDDLNKINAFQIPTEFHEIDIADINIRKLNLEKPLAYSAFNKMCKWLLEQFLLYPNFVFSFI